MVCENSTGILIAGWRSWLSRQFHKLKIVGSSPTHATQQTLTIVFHTLQRMMGV